MSDRPTVIQRFIARIIDIVIVGVLGLFAGYFVGFVFDWLIGTSISIWLYFALFEAFAGATPGKKAIGIKVVDANGERPSVGQALKREAFIVAGSIPFIGPILALVAWISIFVSIRQGREGFHDSWAGGTCVQFRFASQPSDIPTKEPQKT
jgi:uncharacterized RDD family membrane protein YckC